VLQDGLSLVAERIGEVGCYDLLLGPPAFFYNLFALPDSSRASVFSRVAVHTVSAASWSQACGKQSQLTRATGLSTLVSLFQTGAPKLRVTE
jgi:hypothetical protein